MLRNLIRTASLLLLLVRAGALLGQREHQPPIVKITSGALEGSHFDAGSGAAEFLGIPYAAPPIGELRWKPPQPAPHWMETRQAVHFGSPCAQLPAQWLPYIEGNEDCLYLNIWTTDIQPKPNQPVLVYFHGGSNAVGYSQMTPLGSPLSKLGVVVVSANYRLGPFGFLAHPALTAESEHHSSGNYGLLDQLQVLKWVKENISQFGGNPQRITVMGHSAGAVDTCLLMASPLSHELFDGAILESGECQDTLNEDIRKPIKYDFIDSTGESSGERVANDLNLSNNPDILEKLRQTPASEILKAWKNDRALHFDAIVDGWVVPEQPAQIFRESKQMHIPILVGSTADEATVFGHNNPKTVEDYKKHLEQDTGENSEQEFRLYAVKSNDEVPLRAVQLESDEFACGAYSIAQAMTQAGVRPYLYYFTFVDPGKRSRLGAHHGEELFFLSDSFPTDWQHTTEDQRLGNLLRGYWVAFVKTGDPNFDSAPHWPTYESRSPDYLELGESVTVRPISGRIRGLEKLWDAWSHKKSGIKIV